METIFKTTMFLAFMVIMGSVSGQTLTVKGKVTDSASGKPLPGCTVVIEGTPSGTVTDAYGMYSIQAKKGDTLVFSFVGLLTEKRKVTSDVINVSLQPDKAELNDEIVVVGYAIREKSMMTGSVTAVKPATGHQPSFYIRGIGNPRPVVDMEEYNTLTENAFQMVDKQPLSTFSIDVDAASYGNMRRLINMGQMPPVDAIRTEELVNYFSYDYDKPTGNDPVKISAETGECPWNNNHRLVRIGIKAREIPGDKLPASNLVFLIDVSGSMWGPTRLDLVKSSLKLLVNNLREQDRVAIVVYAGAAGEVLPSTTGSDKQKIREAIDGLQAGGSTAGGAGIQLAYKIAGKNFIKGGNNRIILCTDGDFNVGVSSNKGLEKLIEKERESGVFLTILGYGMGNYKDNKLQTLAEKGNGNHAYIDNIQEANRVLVSEFGGTIFTVAKDVKLQIEFNPEHTQAYRLIGYESRLLNSEDFNDDTKDAGEIGVGHQVTAFYEVVPAGVEFRASGDIDPLKYQKQKKQQEKPVYTGSKELLTIKLRYKEPDSNKSKKIDVAVTDNKSGKVSADFRFASAVAMFGQLLTDSKFKGEASYEKVVSLAKTALDNDEQGYRREFIRLAEAAKGLEFTATVEE